MQRGVYCLSISVWDSSRSANSKKGLISLPSSATQPMYSLVLVALALGASDWSSDEMRMPLMPLKQKSSATSLRHMNLWPRTGIESRYAKTQMVLKMAEFNEGIVWSSEMYHT